MRYSFKMVKRVQGTGDASTNGISSLSDDYVGSGDDHVMAFDIGDVADLHAPNIVFQKPAGRQPNGTLFSTRGIAISNSFPGVSSGFRTDADISGNLAIRERDLQRWEPSSDVNANLSLETSRPGVEWDQFNANERLFGVKSNYDESFYTTTIDRTNPQYAEKAARAEKIAREIEASAALNAHVSEERGQIVPEDKGADEEEK
jgi:PAB1-binding protein PBP1